MSNVRVRVAKPKADMLGSIACLKLVEDQCLIEACKMRRRTHPALQGILQAPRPWRRVADLRSTPLRDPEIERSDSSPRLRDPRSVAIESATLVHAAMVVDRMWY